MPPADAGCRIRGAAEWFKTLKEYVHDPLFPEARTDVRVRVAVIGAGVDYTHPEIHQALEDGRIVDCKGFPERLDPSQDFEGVGTYCVSVIMRTMPWVSIFLARVVDEDGRLVKENRYAGAVQVKTPSLYGECSDPGKGHCLGKGTKG